MCLLPSCCLEHRHEGWGSSSHLETIKQRWEWKLYDKGSEAGKQEEPRAQVLEDLGTRLYSLDFLSWISCMWSKGKSLFDLSLLFGLSVTCGWTSLLSDTADYLNHAPLPWQTSKLNWNHYVMFVQKEQHTKKKQQKNFLSPSVLFWLWSNALNILCSGL